jgi:hypothetical protein
MIDRDAVLIRYPGDMFMQRTHTYVPGGEAYPQIIVDSIEVVVVSFQVRFLF